ncbi:putative 2-amino-3-ketobutyrate coenzyme A ligase [Flavihumibacter petaseus NBRC 106054]|uniref:Putative 2-amino-3-ketobutyrate coenzyme A ligase n=2 Tax=Flavihumibacter TaxID=1004301 RepID=A0A0E9N6Y5_9BACT|nr:putative 2-amino-3-ketobutyrate coenzyme A ligase [Flavihumibacter petaseus NBRC 106054]
MNVFGQAGTTPAKPKLVVGMVVDQMRWDYLYRYKDRYQANGGFKRLLTQGFSNENTLIPYTPTITACGHTCIYTGSVPAVHGITGNAWFDRTRNKSVYCTEDPSVKTVGSTTAAGEMSPANLYTTTITDELKLASNFRSKVIGIAVKDRGAILPAGHAADAAYWYDNKTGNWITSTFYRSELPDWLQQYNAAKHVDQYYALGWNTLYPIATYTMSTRDENAFEGKPFGSDAKGFPYSLKNFTGKNFGAISSTPYGNTMTLEVAKAAVKAEGMGKGAFTDFLAVSLSSTDYVGHAFGPNSIEAEDTYLRLDKDLGEFFNFLDQTIGKGQWLFFISADHGVAHVPGFMTEHKIPAGLFDDGAAMKALNASLEQSFGAPNLVNSMYNYQVHLNLPVVDSLKLDRDKLANAAAAFMKKQPGVARAFVLENLAETTLPSKIKEMVANGYMPNRSGDVQFLLEPQYLDGGPTGTTHGLWNPYDAHIPLVWMGWKIKPGKSNVEVYMTDIAPTVAALLQIQMPNGCIGKPIEAITR